VGTGVSDCVYVDVCGRMWLEGIGVGKHVCIRMCGGDNGCRLCCCLGVERGRYVDLYT
jgi:hypothetical protein